MHMYMARSGKSRVILYRYMLSYNTREKQPRVAQFAILLFKERKRAASVEAGGANVRSEAG